LKQKVDSFFKEETFSSKRSSAKKPAQKSCESKGVSSFLEEKSLTKPVEPNF
jgi:hypothetical protein